MHKSVQGGTRVYVPVVTPFTKEGNVDIAGFGRLVRNLASNEEVGVVVAGTTGEGHRLSVDEKIRLMEVAFLAKRFRAGSNLEVICGTGTQRTGEAVDIAGYAKALGCEGVLALPPSSCDQNYISGFYANLAKKANGIAIYAYNIMVPGLKNGKMKPETVAALFREGVLAGVKDSSGDKNRIAQWKAEEPKMRVMIGSDRLINYAASYGYADAAVSGAANIVPGMVVDSFRLRGEEGRQAQLRLNAVLDALERKLTSQDKRSFLASVKVWMKSRGFIDSEEVRPNGMRDRRGFGSSEDKMNLINELEDLLRTTCE